QVARGRRQGRRALERAPAPRQLGNHPQIEGTPLARKGREDLRFLRSTQRTSLSAQPVAQRLLRSLAIERSQREQLPGHRVKQLAEVSEWQRGLLPQVKSDVVLGPPSRSARRLVCGVTPM